MLAACIIAIGVGVYLLLKPFERPPGPELEGVSILSAISSDGLNFSAEGGTRISGSVPEVLILQDDTYLMY